MNRDRRATKLIITLTSDQIYRLNINLPAVLNWVEATIPLDVRNADSKKSFNKARDACASGNTNENLAEKVRALLRLYIFVMEINDVAQLPACRQSEGADVGTMDTVPEEFADGMALMAELGLMKQVLADTQHALDEMEKLGIVRSDIQHALDEMEKMGISRSDIQHAFEGMEKMGIVRRTGEFRDGLPCFEGVETVTFDQGKALIDGQDKTHH